MLPIWVHARGFFILFKPYKKKTDKKKGGRFGAVLGPFWGRLGAVWGPVWAVLGPVWAVLGPWKT